MNCGNLVVCILLFMTEILFTVNTKFSSNFVSEEIYHHSTTHLLATIGNSTCHRKWTGTGNLVKSLIQTDTKANSSFIYMSRREIFNLRRACRHEHSSWKFCVLDRSPFGLRWTFESIVTCENQYTTENFQLIFDSLTSNPPTSSSQYVNVVHENLNLDVVNQALMIGTRRNYFNNTEGFIPIAILIITMCQHLNVSIILLPNYKENEEYHFSNHEWNKTLKANMYRSPTVQPRIFARTLTRLDRMSFFDSNKYARIDSVDFNFVYCDQPQLKGGNLWDLSVIFQAFETEVWILLLVLLLICSIILSETCIHPLYTSSAAFALFSGLLGGNVLFGLQNLKYSFLFTTWSIASMLLSNYYTGSMTSLLIKPLGEDVMTSLSDLDKHNYNLVFTNVLPTVFEVVNASAHGKQATSYGNFSVTDHYYNQTVEIEMLKRVLGSSPGNENHHLSLLKFLQLVAIGPKASAFGPWPYCMAVYNRVMTFIKSTNLYFKSSERNFTHCHLGKHLVPSGGLFWGFFPPDNSKPASAFQQFIEAGIYAYWMQEFYGVGYSTRVQERSKVKGPTSIVEDNDDHDAYSPMSLKEGHVFSIFLLWLLGILFSILIFMVESALQVPCPVINFASNRVSYKIRTETIMW